MTFLKFVGDLSKLKPYKATFTRIKNLVNTADGGIFNDPGMWNLVYEASPEFEKTLPPGWSEVIAQGTSKPIVEEKSVHTPIRRVLLERSNESRSKFQRGIALQGNAASGWSL